MNILKRVLPAILLAGLLSACVSDYDIGTVSHSRGECIGVNAVLSPLNPLRVDLFRIVKEGGKYRSVGLEGAYVVLKEDGATLYEAIAEDSVVTLPQTPQTGKTYSIEVSYEGLQTVTARTTVPQAIGCNVSLEAVEDIDGYPDYLIRMDGFDVDAHSKASLWVTAWKQSADDEKTDMWELYCSSALTDRENSDASGNGAPNKWVGSVYYELFLRIRNKNTFMLDEILFTPYMMNRLDETETLVVQFTSANPEYDQYCKTLYRQELLKSYNDDPLSMMFYQPDAIYCNIENGLGIFAGINQQNHYFDELH